jgi:hypothetical protein
VSSSCDSSNGGGQRTQRGGVSSNALARQTDSEVGVSSSCDSSNGGGQEPQRGGVSSSCDSSNGGGQGPRRGGVRIAMDGWMVPKPWLFLLGLGLAHANAKRNPTAGHPTPK